MSSDSFEKNLAQKADEFHAQVRDGMWTSIASQLPPEKPNKKRAVVLWWSLSAAAISLMVLVFIYNSKVHSIKNTNEFVSHAKIESKGDSKAQLSDPIVEDL